MKYNTEEEFLKNYNADNFEKLSMTSDILVISISDEENTNYRKTSKKRMSILMVKRSDYPFKDKWCLPGGFLDVKKETLEECAKRILKKETNLSHIYIEQLYTFDALKRDPRMRVVSTSFMALVDKTKLEDSINKDADWFDVTLFEEKNGVAHIILDNGLETISIKIKKKLRELSTDRYDYEEIENPIAFDHSKVILAGLERLRNKINYTDIVFHMMPKYFTLKELQQVYEVILNKKLLDPAFRRIIKNKVKKTDKMKTGEGHRPSVLFEYNPKK